ncbi:MAG: autotransporter-associated beta strand repeat-containing protein [Candidatus Ancaeobacter aquaticus]|nr:autotransporter-associated beta strand repeat-containing protein [Candidatus Ancaeobacter aquaticus]
MKPIKILFGIFVIVFGVSLNASAYTVRTWDGGGDDNDFSTPENWEGDAAPWGDDGLTFDGSTRLTPYNNWGGIISYGIITFNSTGFDISTMHSLLLNSGITNNAGLSNAFSANIGLQHHQSFTNNGTLLTFSGHVAIYDQTLTVTGSGATNMSAIIDYGHGGDLIKSGNGTLTISGACTYAGGTTISAGSLAYGAGGALDDDGAINVSGGILDISSYSDTVGDVTLTSGSIIGTSGKLTGNSYVVEDGTISAILAGEGALEKTSGGTVTLSGANEYSGGTTITTGTLVGMVATLQNRNITNNATLCFERDTTAEEYTHIISGTGIVEKEGDNTLTFSEASTYTGDTKINEGTLQCGANNVLSTSTDVVVEAGAVLDLNDHSDTIYSVSGAGNVTLGSGTLTTISSWESLEFSGVMSGTDGSFVKNANGTLTLTGENTYTGGTTVSNGTLVFGAHNVLANSSPVLVSGSSVVLDIDEYSDIVGAVTFEGGWHSEIKGTAGVLTGTSYEVQYGTVSAKLGGEGKLTKTTDHQVTLSGANTYTGGTEVSVGALTLGVDNVLANSGAVTISGGTLDIAGYSDIVAVVTLTSGEITGTDGVLTGTSYEVQSGSISAILAGEGALEKTTEESHVYLSGANTYSGGTTVSAGTLRGTTTSLQGDITNNANLWFDQGTDGTYSGVISSTGEVEKAGEGNVTLSGANTYGGGTTISNGILTGTTTSLQGNITNSATVCFNQSTTGTYSDVISASGALIKSGEGTVTLSGENTYYGGTTISAGTLKGTVATLQNQNITNNATLCFERDTTAELYSAVISGSGAVIKSGDNTLTFAGENIYSGGTTVSGGTLTGTPTSLQGDITNDATLCFINDGTYSDEISGSGALIKSDNGTVTFSGTNTYSGTTSINASTLSVTGSIANSATTINDGGKLIGSGTVFNLTVADGGTFSPGLSPGTLNAGPTIWQSGGTYLWEINDATGTEGDDPGYDWLNITGGLNITATSESKFNLDLSTMGTAADNFDNSQDYSWVIATASGGITGFSADKFDVDSTLFTNSLGVGNFSISQNVNDLSMNFNAIPEPSTYALFGIGLLGLIVGWMRKQRRKL